MRCNIAAREEPNPERTCLLAELRFRMSGPNTKLDDFLSATPPPLDEPASIERVCDERISRSRRVLPLQILGHDSERQRPVAPYLQPVIVWIPSSAIRVAHKDSPRDALRKRDPEKTATSCRRPRGSYGEPERLAANPQCVSGARTVETQSLFETRRAKCRPYGWREHAAPARLVQERTRCLVARAATRYGTVEEANRDVDADNARPLSPPKHFVNRLDDTNLDHT